MVKILTKVCFEVKIMSLPAPVPAILDLFGLTAPEYRQGGFLSLFSSFWLKRLLKPYKKTDRGEQCENNNYICLVDSKLSLNISASEAVVVAVILRTCCLLLTVLRTINISSSAYSNCITFGSSHCGKTFCNKSAINCLSLRNL